MRCLVTGVAGFIGSHLAEALVAEGHEVVGLDSFSDSYPREIKESNLSGLRNEAAFEFVEGDVARIVLGGLLRGVDWVFHQAAQAGVRASWGKLFQTYADNNVMGTQRLLEAVRETDTGKKVRRILYASSSSIYGDAEETQTPEEITPRPISPYGVTKLAGEQLAYLYWKQMGLPVVSLRYFTVYGPRQRPDMAFHRFIEALLSDAPIEIYGDGEQTRDFTYVSDAVAANLAAAVRGRDGTVYNIGGGERASINRVVRLLEEVSGRRARTQYLHPQAGDVRHTWGDISRAGRELGFCPRVGLTDGLRRQCEWHLRRRSDGNQQRASGNPGVSKMQGGSSSG
ncbi:MAG: NAD-dependent epimerase/dehydratase family protein [Nitrospinota bacterium]